MGFLDFLGGNFSPLVEKAKDDIQVMMQTGHKMFSAATAHLLENEVLEEDLNRMDATINNGEQQIRRAVFEHLSLHPEQDLIFSLNLVSIVNEAERIGDNAKSIAKISQLARGPRLGPRVDPLRAFRNQIEQMFTDLNVGFYDGDEKISLELLKRHQELKPKITAYIEALAADPDLSGNEGVVYALTARMLSRTSSHIANIASTVVSPIDQIRRNTP